MHLIVKLNGGDLCLYSTYFASFPIAVYANRLSLGSWNKKKNKIYHLGWSGQEISTFASSNSEFYPKIPEISVRM